MQKNIIITLLFSILIALFAILNAGVVPVNLIFTQIDISAALVILISASIGAIIVYSLDAVSKIKTKKKHKELEKKNENLNKEIIKLNALLLNNLSQPEKEVDITKEEESKDNE